MVGMCDRIDFVGEIAVLVVGLDEDMESVPLG